MFIDFNDDKLESKNPLTIPFDSRREMMKNLTIDVKVLESSENDIQEEETTKGLR